MRYALVVLAAAITAATLGTMALARALRRPDPERPPCDN